MPITVAQYVRPHHDLIDQQLEADFPDVSFRKAWTEAELVDALPTADVLVTSSVLYTPELGRKLIELAKRLRWIQFTTVGMDGIPPDTLPNGVILTNAKGARTKVIAGHAIALLLAVMRGIRRFQAYHNDRIWARDEIGGDVTTTDGRTMVIVGMGDVGHDIARKAKAFDFHVIGVSRAAQPSGPVDQVVPRSRLIQVLSEADVVVMSAALDEGTRHILAADQIAAMKPSAIVINVARGGLIDEAALVRALRERRIAGAGLDVTEVEPLPSDSELWSLDNVVLSPHVAGQGAHSQKAILRELLAENISRFRSGQPLRNSWTCSVPLK